MGYSVELAGLAVQNFVSAAVGIAVAVDPGAGLRGTQIGNARKPLGGPDARNASTAPAPALAGVSAMVLIVGAVIQNFAGFIELTALSGGAQSLPSGQVASQEASKLLGTNGAGFFNVNSAHPFENPTGWTSLFQIVLMFAIPFSLPRTFGAIMGDRRQGYAIATMASIFLVSQGAVTIFEFAGAGTAPELAGAAIEGKEQRFGIAASTLFASTSTLTSTGAVKSMYDSYTALGGMMPMINKMLGEVAPGGVGYGLYGMLMLAVFVGMGCYVPDDAAGSFL